MRLDLVTRFISVATEPLEHVIALKKLFYVLSKFSLRIFQLALASTSQVTAWQTLVFAQALSMGRCYEVSAKRPADSAQAHASMQTQSLSQILIELYLL